MNIMLGLFNLGGGEIILILAIILILFGAKKLPELAKGLGQGIKEFKKATQNASEGLLEAMAESPSTTPRPLTPATTASVDPGCIVPNTPAGPHAIREANSTFIGLLALTAATNLAVIQQVRAQAPVDPICGTNAWPTAVQSSFQIAMNNAMRVMDANMMAAPTSSNADYDFAAMMIPHHQGAVDMAQAVLLHGKDPVLRRLAQEIIVTQEQEIEVMRLRLASLEVGAATGPEPGQAEAVGQNPVARGNRLPTDCFRAPRFQPSCCTNL